jgi:hypothetical protein
MKMDKKMYLPASLAQSLLDDLGCLYINAYVCQNHVPLDKISDSAIAAADTYAKIKFFEITSLLETNGFEWDVVEA